MIGDVPHKAGSKAKSFTKKHGKSFKTIDDHKDMPDDSGDAGTHAVARRATKGMKPGPGTPDKQNPKAQRVRKIEAWCQGRGEYR